MFGQPAIACRVIAPDVAEVLEAAAAADRVQRALVDDGRGAPERARERCQLGPAVGRRVVHRVIRDRRLRIATADDMDASVEHGRAHAATGPRQGCHGAPAVLARVIDQHLRSRHVRRRVESSDQVDQRPDRGGYGGIEPVPGQISLMLPCVPVKALDGQQRLPVAAGAGEGIHGPIRHDHRVCGAAVEQRRRLAPVTAVRGK